MVAVPGDMPDTIPVPAPTPAMPGALLVHVPPAVPSTKVIVPPVHTDDEPEIGEGVRFTVMGSNALHPPGNV